MSAEEINTIPASDQTESMGFARRLSRKLSRSRGSREGTSQGGQANNILQRSASIRNEVNQGNLAGAKDVIMKGQTANQSTGQEGTRRASSGAAGENVQRTTSQTGMEDTGGASGSAAGAEGKTKSLDDDNTQQAAMPLSQGGTTRDDTAKSSTGDTNAEQKTSNEKKDAKPKNQKRKSSVAAGLLEPNYDIRKGPITTPGTFQAKNFHNSTGRETIVERGTTSKEVSDQADADTANAGGSSTGKQSLSQEATAGTGNANRRGNAGAGEGFSVKFIDDELHGMEDISPDVFDDGTANTSVPKKTAGGATSGQYHMDKGDLDKRGSKPTQKGGAAEAAAATTAVGGGYGLGKGAAGRDTFGEYHMAKEDLDKQGSKPIEKGAAAEATAATTAVGGGYGLGKGAAGRDTFGEYHMAKEDLDKQGSKPTEKGAAAEAAAATTAVGGGYGLGTGATGSQPRTARAQDQAATSPKSKVGSTAEGDGSGQVLTSNQTNEPDWTHARAISGENLAPKTPTTTTGYSADEPNQTSGLRSTTTSQTNNALYNSSTTRSDEGNVAGGGMRSPQQQGTSGISSGAGTKRVVRPLSGGGYKLTVLQDKVQAVSQKCKTQLGASASEISERSPTVDAFFDAVAAERLRWMPRDGSRLDCSLRWASRLAYAVDALRVSVDVFAPAAKEAAMLIWGFCILLLESDMDNTDVFESVFGRYGRVAVGINLLLQYETAYKISPELQPEVAAVFADLLEMVCSTTLSCVEGFKSKESDQVIGRHVDAAFVAYAKRFSTHWNRVVDAHTVKLVEGSSLIDASADLGSLRQFLAVQDRPLQFILDSRAHSIADGSFEYFNNILYDFTVASSPVMLISGGPGSGKSALAQWIVERLQESAEHDSWNVIPYTIRADIPVATLPLRILKGLLHQLLDHSVSDLRTQEAVLLEVAKAAEGAINGAGDDVVEESLWRGIQTGLATNTQYMFVIDGLDQIKGGDTSAIACLNRFCELLSTQNAGSKMIAFTRPLSLKVDSKGVQHYTIEASQTKADLEAYVTKMLVSGASFDTHKSDQLQAAVSAIARRAQGSFSWAEMGVAYAKQQKTLSLAVAAIQSLPQWMPELLDFLSKGLDFSQQGTINIVSWLAAAERPLLVEEIEELLNVNPKGPNYSADKITDSHDILNALSPLVMTRDGVVSFCHTCVRDHVIKQAKDSSGKSQLSIKDGHYDLLTRCLASVQLSMDEDVDISMDKLNIEERNHFFDKYVVSEYTARYWLSHLLSSPLVSDDGEFQFTPSFTKLVPATVLFARLELTCRESQFTRSSVVELYRLASDIRRLVFGDKSMALLQSSIFSARVSRLAHAGHADETCYETWKLSQELLGQSHPITLKCAEMMTQSFSERDSLTSQQEDIMKYLILTDSEITGVDFNQRLKYLGMIVGMYKSRGDNKSALFISKHFYQQVLQKYGTNSRQSSETADFLTGHFSSTGTDEMGRDIARTKYDNMVRTMEVTDDRRIKYSLYMARMYEEQGDNVHTQAVLSSLWAGLSSQDTDSVNMMDKKFNVALEYYQFLRRQGRNEEAEVVIRELVADIEVTGIHSPEMMQHVQLLRTETREMLMYNLDRSLAVLMWRYYKENHQEYSPEGTALALSIAQSMASAVSSNDSSSLLSVQDRKLLVELLDSISASKDNMTVTTLIMCHNLSSIYVREGDWEQASECTMAVLQHIWPTVEKPESHPKFSQDLAPPAADLALVLAYCHFRRLHLEQATTVYENAFGCLISSENVPVPSVLAVAKAVVEFHETSFQFPKALSLLHTVSNFLAARLGETHKETIDNVYLEAALATRLEMHSDAKRMYQRIYRATTRENAISPEGIEAAVALIGIYEREMDWSSALHVYRSLWPTLVVEDNKYQERTYDHELIDRMLEKTYMGYISILTAQKGSDFSEQYKIASEYVMTCQHVHGPTSQKTLNATLLFAELCESNDAYIDRAIALYKIPLETTEWVETAESSKPLEQMTAPLPITLKHKLAQLFVRRHDSTSEARSLYTEEFQLAKKTQGYFSTTTLSWLRELALAHSRMGTPASVQQGNVILHTYCTDVLHAGGEPDMIGDWARRIASVYLECGFIEGGNNVLDELRYRVVYSPEASTMALPPRRDAIFIAAFEEVFGRRASYDQIMKEMETETKTHQTFSRNLSGHDFIPTLISGHLLYTMQTEQKRHRPATDTKNKLYAYFCTNLSATSVSDKEVVQQFYQICLREVHNEDYNMRILTRTTDLVRDLCNASRFQEATILTGVLHSFMHLTDGLNNHSSIKTATQLCLYLSGHKAAKCTDQKTYNDMSTESKLLLQEIMTTCKSLGIEMVDLPFNDLNDIITLLGEHDMFPELETILTQLWTSRIVQRTWTPDVVVWIGRRLAETRFCRGNVDSAIQLCRDICYNLRQVWGSCDPVTLEMTKLLSALFTASENHQSAVTLHEGVLYDLLNDSDAKGHANAADTVSQHMELLRRARGRLGGQSSGRASAHAELFQALAERFGVREGVGEENGQDFGVWAKPRRFSIDVEDMEEEGLAHRNHLRESSGSGAPRRISVQAL
ncbi:hypothetical protein N7535_004640 [Penicillium sp. DV-2018c]|nr:hypothetical protein N7461_008221 [Penicillium sp. DV-2018c]KAJ5570980.1 hypothetical protein N7535_004640 [Penicillium sp. DV-2018c]